VEGMKTFKLGRVLCHVLDIAVVSS
jgi:hypothetical protein